MAGQITTFYSYKGGTGRSMLLANVAWVLAAAGKRVLAIDWDLEAPGLHHYFAPCLDDPSGAENLGLIDMVVEASAALATAEENEEIGPDWFDRTVNLLDYTQELNWDFPGDGVLDLMIAGKQSASYSTRVNSFDWRSFYEKLRGGAFFELFKAKVGAYDYVLIDSRTGVSDTSGICTIQMPDKVVVCFTANEQSTLGASGVANSIRAEWAKMANRPPSRILPVLCRVEHAEKLKLEAARARAQQLFAPSLAPMAAVEQEEYWKRAQVVYWPWYAYEEVLAAFAEERSYEGTVLAAAETMSDLVTDGDVRRLKQIPTPPQRDVFLRKALRKTAADAPGVIMTGSPRAWDRADFVKEHLQSADKSKILSVLWPDLAQQAAAFPTVPVVLLLTKDSRSEIDERSLRDLVPIAASERKVIPILLPGAAPGDAPDALSKRPPIAFSDEGDRNGALLSLSYALRSGSILAADDARVEEYRQRRQLAASAEAWWKADRDETFLLRGRALDEADRLLASATVAPSKLERDFLTVSRDLEARVAAAGATIRLEAAQAELRRARLIGGAAAAGFLVMIATAGVSYGWFQNEKTSADELRAKLERRDKALGESSRLAQASWTALQAPKPELALALSAEALRRSQSVGEVGAAAYTSLNRALAVLKGRPLPIAGGATGVIAVSATGDRIALAVRRPGGTEPHAVAIVDKTGKAEPPLPLASAVSALRFDSSGVLAIGTEDGHLWLRDPNAPDKPVAVRSLSTARVAEIVTGPSGIAAARWTDRRAALWTRSGPRNPVVHRDIGKMLETFVDKPEISALAISQNDRSVIVAIKAGALFQIEPDSGSVAEVYDGRGVGTPERIVLSADGDRLATIGTNGKLNLYKRGADGLLVYIDSIDDVVDAAAQDKRKQLVVLSGAGNIKLIDFDAHELPTCETAAACAGKATSLSLDPQGLFIATAGGANTFTIRCAKRPEFAYAFLGHDAPVTSLAFSPSAGFIVSTARDGGARSWPLQALPEDDAACLAPASASEAPNRGATAAERPGSGELVLLQDVPALLERAGQAGRSATREEVAAVLGESGVSARWPQQSPGVMQGPSLE